MAASLTLRGSSPASLRISVVADVHGSYEVPSLPEFQRRGKVVVKGREWPWASVCRTVSLSLTVALVPIAVLPASGVGVPDTPHPVNRVVAAVNATVASVFRNCAELRAEICG